MIAGMTVKPMMEQGWNYILAQTMPVWQHCGSYKTIQMCSWNCPKSCYSMHLHRRLLIEVFKTYCTEPISTPSSFKWQLILTALSATWHRPGTEICAKHRSILRSAFHEIQAFVLTNGTSRLQNQWGASGKYSKGTQGKSKHDHARVHMLLIAVWSPQKHTHALHTQTHLH